jgi:hypothetical protein
MRLSETEVIKILCKIHVMKHTSIWFQDEMRIGQRGAQMRISACKGTRPRVVRQQQSKSAYIFGAMAWCCPMPIRKPWRITWRG